jgi:hypothetical protein
MRVITPWCNIYVSRETSISLSERFYEGQTLVWRHGNFRVMKDYNGTVLVVEIIPDYDEYEDSYEGQLTADEEYVAFLADEGSAGPEDNIV